ncbi:hypothetical protein BABINDRAFT_170710 [Babjeviella inositovora NRRL Y-12698]|uniref:Serine/threonine-protein kinase BUR1 n=1 Tax=Babjeviella inositovora NRRL Y-12698 TaxID=984486 RepID=A0A1E3QTI7_9ASCO|nr:uncharacterized protein BABINDRAFT_170710 [Babjeviella inositovora NRRL Y-12698]ODQ81001.1 hypothetical protein BABINDRAFT_170710 [Babjeviella inositovora NRRL Y-12698]
MKRLRLESEKEGFPITAIREIRLLQSFHHPNVVGLLEMMVEGSRVYMNFDYMDHDLSGVLNHPNLSISDAHRKFLFKQLMEGLAYLHSKRVIHRDIKASNILLDSIGRLKIADFGLARTMKFVKPGESPDYTNRVITLWYRPPELLLGSTDYGREVDIWGVGCLLVELFNKKAIFPGEDEISQVHRIFDVMGSPTDSLWPQVDSLPWYELVKPLRMRPNAFKHRYGFLLSDNCFDLAQKLLTVNPEQRITAEEALKHSYFTEDPVPEPLHFLKDVVGEWHEFETKKRRKKEREDKQRKDSEGRSEAKSLVERSVQEK